MRFFLLECTFADTAKFLNDLKTYDRDNIVERVILEIEPFMGMPEFQPEVTAPSNVLLLFIVSCACSRLLLSLRSVTAVEQVIDRASKACSGICMWVRAMYKYYYVAKMVEPKKKKLVEAQERLDRTMADLNTAKQRLKDVLDRIADLEDQFTATQVPACCDVQ